VNPPTHKATIYYYDIGDYLSREQKLEIIRNFGSIAAMRDKFQILQPNKHGDWISHRDEGFEELIPLAPEKKFDGRTQSVFTVVSRGFETARDAWIYNFSNSVLTSKIRGMIGFYNEQVLNLEVPSDKKPSEVVSMDETVIKWSSSLLSALNEGITINYSETDTKIALYRPFTKNHAYCGERVIHRRGQFDQIFPTPEHENLLICVSSVGDTGDFTALVANVLPDLHLMGTTQCFPLYWYEKNEQAEHMNLFDGGEEYTRRDGISDFILTRVRELCGPKVTKRDIFFYVYGILHSEQYRKKFAINLKKTLPRLPLPEEPAIFRAFSKAGAELAELHLNYETLPSHPDVREDSPKKSPCTRVTKMRFAKEGKEENKSAIIYNDDITLWNIPLETYEYVVNGKSAIEWIMERYQVTTHKESGIVNDPNLWCDEHDNPRYILDLIKRIVTLSLETRRIVKALPDLKL